MAAAPGDFELIRSIVPAAKRPVSSKLQATGTQLLGSEPISLRSIAELPATGGISPGPFTGLQAAGTLNSQPLLFRALSKFRSLTKFRALSKLFGAEPELFFASSAECPLVVWFLRILPFIRRGRGQKPTMRSS